MSAVTGNETDAEKIARLSGEVFTLKNQLKDSEANCNRIIAASQRGDKVDVLQLELSVTKLEDEKTALGMAAANAEAELENMKKGIKGYQTECREVEQALGQSLGYPWYRDDQKNFPNTTDDDGVCVGEHTPSTIAMEAGRTITELKQKVKTLEETMIHPDAMDALQTSLDEAREAQISLFDLDYPPRASQGAPRHEVEDILTADTVNFWIRRIDQLTADNQELQTMLDNRNSEMQANGERMNAFRETASEANRQATWRAQQISRVENLLQWGLRKIIMHTQTPITGYDVDRANNIFRHVFPHHAQEFRTNSNRVRSMRVPSPTVQGERINIAMPTRAWGAGGGEVGGRNDTADAMGYAVAAASQPPAYPPPNARLGR